MRMASNQKLVRRFEAGMIAEAILGDGPMFIPDVDDPTAHDRILVIGELLDWAEEGERRRTEAQAGILEAVRRSIVRNEAADAAAITWSLLVIADTSEDAAYEGWSELRAMLLDSAEDGRHVDDERLQTVLRRLDKRVAQAAAE
jgi:hypothetical protein